MGSIVCFTLDENDLIIAREKDIGAILDRSSYSLYNQNVLEGESLQILKGLQIRSWFARHLVKAGTVTVLEASVVSRDANIYKTIVVDKLLVEGGFLGGSRSS